MHNSFLLATIGFGIVENDRSKFWQSMANSENHFGNVSLGRCIFRYGNTFRCENAFFALREYVHSVCAADSAAGKPSREANDPQSRPAIPNAFHLATSGSRKISVSHRKKGRISLGESAATSKVRPKAFAGSTAPGTYIL